MTARQKSIITVLENSDAFYQISHIIEKSGLAKQWISDSIS